MYEVTQRGRGYFYWDRYVALDRNKATIDRSRAGVWVQGFKVLVKRMDFEASSFARGHQSTRYRGGAFHGCHYRVTSAWPNVICLTPPWWFEGNRATDPTPHGLLGPLCYCIAAPLHSCRTHRCRFLCRLVQTLKQTNKYLLKSLRFVTHWFVTYKLH